MLLEAVPQQQQLLRWSLLTLVIASWSLHRENRFNLLGGNQVVNRNVEYGLSQYLKKNQSTPS